MAWTKEELLDDLRKVGTLYDRETDPKKKEELNNFLAHMYYLVSDFYYKDPIEVKKEELFFKVLYSLTKYSIYIPIINDFVITASENDVEQVHNKKMDFPGFYTKNQVFGLSKQFYESIGGKTYSSFLEFDKGKDHFVDFCKMNPNDSATYCVPPLNKYYINLGNNGDARDVLEAYIHEIAHVITSMQHHDRYYSTDNFVEIESFFYEILANDFLYRETGDEYFKEQERYKLSRFYKHGTILDICGFALGNVMDNIDKIKKPNKKFIKICKKEGYEKPEMADFDNTIRYVFSYMCAVELVEIYKQDKETALHLLDVIVSKDKEKSEYERIVTTIDPNEHAAGYMKSLKKRN